jgi:hypothetical protein
LLAAGWRSSTLRHRLQRAAVFFAGASVPLALVIERNLRLANEPFGSRGNPNLSVGQALSEIKVGIVRWFLPNGATSAVRVVFLAAIAVAALVSLATRTRSTAGPAADTRSSAGEGATPLWPFALLVTGYLAFLVVTAATESLDPIDRRLLSPAFALGVIFLVAAIDRLAKVRVPGRTWAAAGAVAAVAWLVCEVQTTASDLRIIHRDGVGFTGSYYRLSTVVAAIRERRIAPVYSDQTDALYFLTGVRSACWPTSAYVPCQDAQLDLRRAGNAKDVYVAWFVQPGEARPPVPTALRRQIRLVPLVTGANSGLYRVLLLHGHT